MNQKFSETIRGIWSHFNARLVCSIFASSFSFASMFLLYLVEQGSDARLFSFRSFSLLGLQITYLWFCVGIIIVISLVLVVGARRPYREAVKLEYYFLKSKIEEDKTSFEKLVQQLLEATVIKKSVAQNKQETTT